VERPWLGALAATVVVGVATGWAAWCTSEEASTVARRELADTDSKDAGTSGLGETTSRMSRETSSALSPRQGMAEEPMPEPLPGQTRPDEKGRCPRKRQVALNGACWLEFQLDSEGCAELEGSMFKGRCYAPMFSAGRRTTSSPPHQQP
jgi:hypothetical protein